MNGKKIKLAQSSISNLEKEAVLSVLDDAYLGMGVNVQQFEVELKQYLKTSADIICVNSGTAALHLALAALGLSQGDEVLVPSLTYLASFQAISATQARPVACDVVEETGFIDLRDAEKRVTASTRAIMPVHYASNFSGMSDVHAFAKKHNLRVVEDAAHSFGSLNGNGLKVGTSGDILCFSFDGIKNITCGEGGAVVSFDPKVSAIIKNLRLLGVENDTQKRYKGKRSWSFDVKLQGYRYHMSNIMAAIGSVQLTRINEFSSLRSKIVGRYKKELSLISSIKFFEFKYENIVPHIFVIKTQRRDELREFLLSEGIETGVHYLPNHLLSKYKTNDRLPVSEKISEEVVSLPCHCNLTDVDQTFVIAAIKGFFDDC